MNPRNQAVIKRSRSMALVVVVLGAFVTFAIYDNQPPSTQQRVHTTLAAVDSQLKGKTHFQQRKLLALAGCKNWPAFAKDISASDSPTSYAYQVMEGLTARFNRRFDRQLGSNSGNNFAIMAEMHRYCVDILVVHAPG